jgi:hypothetical protein
MFGEADDMSGLFTFFDEIFGSILALYGLNCGGLGSPYG